ncbi:MAG: asparagine--tRNA ligase, partial [Desulfobacula sp.]|nr:asparagine--tRNA ligase [Desulfobacula sp.]
MKRTKIDVLLKLEKTLGEVLIKGWVRTKRDSKEFCFMEVNDGSALKSIQVIASNDLGNYPDIEKITTGTSVIITGQLVESPGKGQKWEIQASDIEIINIAPESYPLQKKRHSDEFLRTIAHLRPRTNKYGAAFRIRSEMMFAIHKFYKEKGFRYLTTPLITGADCEGAGELFRVTSLDPEMVKKQGKMDFKHDFFGQESNLTVSGQLSAEMFALALGDVYTFGPTFRAENSNTSRHVAEFWMLEPEMAFCDLNGDMNLAEEMLQYLVRVALDECSDDIDLFGRFIDKKLISRLTGILDTPFTRITYTEAIDELQESGRDFEFPIKWGVDLQAEHERFLAEEVFKRPVIIRDYPKTIKPFYMRVNDDNKTVAAIDILLPGIGEIIGGSQREERFDVLRQRIIQAGIDPETYSWYLDLRRFGS